MQHYAIVVLTACELQDWDQFWILFKFWICNLLFRAFQCQSK